MTGPARPPAGNGDGPPGDSGRHADDEDDYWGEDDEPTEPDEDWLPPTGQDQRAEPGEPLHEEPDGWAELDVEEEQVPDHEWEPGPGDLDDGEDDLDDMDDECGDASSDDTAWESQVQRGSWNDGISLIEPFSSDSPPRRFSFAP